MMRLRSCCLVLATVLLLTAQLQPTEGVARDPPTKSEIFQVVKYGPADCVSTYPSEKGTCILKTDCAEKALEGVSMGLVCADAQGETVRHVFGADSFEHKETFDTLIPCTQCLALDNFDSGRDTEEAVLKDEVNALKSDFNALNARVTTLEEADGGGGGPECECLPNGLEEATGAPNDLGFPGPYIARTGDDGAKSYFPASYGSQCKAWEENVDPACKSDFPPAYCASKWCYVSSKCKVDDVKKTLYFPGKELYYSYKNCGSFDAFTAQACLAKGEESCHDPCAWNPANAVCQNKLCQCTGDNGLTGDKLKKWGDYGEKCSAWDKESCATDYGDSENVLGLWCCKQWCYVEESCPSAKPSAVAKGLFYTYYTCPDDVSEIKECPWKEPVDFSGNPLPLTKEATQALEEAAAEGFLSAHRHVRPQEEHNKRKHGVHKKKKHHRHHHKKESDREQEEDDAIDPDDI